MSSGANENGMSVSTADETTPLLGASQAGPRSPPNEELVQHEGGKLTSTEPNGTAIQGHSHPQNYLTDNEDAPLPRLQIFLLCYCALVEPIAYFSIFPFVNQMVKEIGSIAEENVGFWSGSIESLFSLTQMLLMIFYGRAADRIGRKPVLVFSLTGVALATGLFGMSKTLWQMILSRCLAGVFAGSAVTVRVMITENCTTKNQARAFSFYAFTRNLGIFIGPLLGGAFSKPAEQYPSVFGHNEFLKSYPYALPTITTGAIAATATILSALFIKETLNRKDGPPSTKYAPMSTWEILKSPGVFPMLYLYGHTTLLGLAFTAVVPVFFFTQPALGGYGFTPQRISVCLALLGASQALWILIAFPPLQRRYSTGAVLRACAFVWPFMFAMFPVGNVLLLRDVSKVIFWTLVVGNTVCGSGVSMAFTCVQLALNDIAPSPSALGTLNALALTLVSGIRAVAPALFSAVFATGVKKHILAGEFVWAVMVPLALGLAVAVRWLPEKAEGKIKDDVNGETR